MIDIFTKTISKHISLTWNLTTTKNSLENFVIWKHWMCHSVDSNLSISDPLEAGGGLFLLVRLPAPLLGYGLGVESLVEKVLSGCLHSRHPLLSPPAPVKNLAGRGAAAPPGLSGSHPGASTAGLSLVEAGLGSVEVAGPDIPLFASPCGRRGGGGGTIALRLPDIKHQIWANITQVGGVKDPERWVSGAGEGGGLCRSFQNWQPSSPLALHLVAHLGEGRCGRDANLGGQFLLLGYKTLRIYT